MHYIVKYCNYACCSMVSAAPPPALLRLSLPLPSSAIVRWLQLLQGLYSVAINSFIVYCVSVFCAMNLPSFDLPAFLGRVLSLLTH